MEFTTTTMRGRGFQYIEDYFSTAPDNLSLEQSGRREPVIMIKGRSVDASASISLGDLRHIIEFLRTKGVMVDASWDKEQRVAGAREAIKGIAARGWLNEEGRRAVTEKLPGC